MQTSISIRSMDFMPAAGVPKVCMPLPLMAAALISSEIQKLWWIMKDRALNGSRMRCHSSGSAAFRCRPPSGGVGGAVPEPRICAALCLELLLKWGGGGCLRGLKSSRVVHGIVVSLFWDMHREGRGGGVLDEV
jgi:hypothetical protein